MRLIHSLLPTALLLPLAAARFENDFTPYPAGARSCLESADKASGCDGNTVPTMNKCLCADKGDFITSTAECVGKKSAGDLEATYTLLKVNCDGSDTPMDISKAKFVKLGRDAADDEDETSTSSTSSSEPTPTSSSSSTSSPTDEPTETPTETAPPEEEGGLSTGATAGIAVAATAVGIALLGTAIFFFVRRRRAQNPRDESNPMLGPSPNPMLSPHDPRASVPVSSLNGSSAYGGYRDSEGKPMGAWGPESFAGSPPLQQQQQQQQMQMQGWESRPPSWDPQGWAAPQGYAPVPAGGVMPQAYLGQGSPPPGAEVFELASTERRDGGPPLAEMQGSHPYDPSGTGRRT